MKRQGLIWLDDSWERVALVQVICVQFRSNSVGICSALWEFVPQWEFVPVNFCLQRQRQDFTRQSGETGGEIEARGAVERTSAELVEDFGGHGSERTGAAGGRMARRSSGKRSLRRSPDLQFSSAQRLSGTPLEFGSMHP